MYKDQRSKQAAYKGRRYSLDLRIASGVGQQASSQESQHAMST